MSDLPNPLESFLNHPPDEPAPAHVREAILQRTAAEIVKRRRSLRWQPLALAAGWAASIVLAFHLGGWWFAASPELPGPSVAAPTQVEPKPNPTTPDPAPPTPLRDPVALEWKAFDERGPERSKLYVEAGRRYLALNQDVGNAIRCYAQAFQDSSPLDLQTLEEDDPILMAFKLSRFQKEIRRATP